MKVESILKNIKSDFFMNKIFAYMDKLKVMKIINYNKILQKRLKLSLEKYKEYFEILSPIIIEINIAENNHGLFINAQNDYFHAYFDNNKEEIKRKYINELENVKKIKIIIDYQIKSFEGLFEECKCIESINFKKFHRNNIISMKYMFYKCSSLKEINFSNFNTDNVTDMGYMFYECELLNELNLSKFNTHNVTYMGYMFDGCRLLKDLKISNFNTIKVTDMFGMNFNC